MSSGRVIRLIEDGDGEWSAVDEESGVATRGETRQQALENLDEVLALQTGDGGEPIEDEEAYLREHGIDPEDLEDTRALPEFMK